jgi:hypothetical protein
MSSESLGIALRATVTAVRALVAAMHDGRLQGFPAPTLLRPTAQYWTPSFQQGHSPNAEGSQCYNALHISVLLGNASPSRRPHDIVKLALLLLELQEIGELTEQDLEDIYSGEDGFTMNMLRTVLIKTKDVHYAAEAQEILELCNTQSKRFILETK